MAIITTPRPPLNLFNRACATVNNTQEWTTLYEPPTYRIPENGPNPQRDILAVALITSLVVAPNKIAAQWSGPLVVSLRRWTPGGTTFLFGLDLEVPQDDFAVFDLGKQNLPTADRLQVRVGTGAAGSNTMAADFQLSFVLNQREEYEVL